MLFYSKLYRSFKALHNSLLHIIPSQQKNLALLDIHKQLEFNNKIITQALLEIDDLSPGYQWKSYLDYCIRKLFQRSTSSQSAEMNQLEIICLNMNFLLISKDLNSREILTMISEFFSLQFESSTSKLLDYLLITVKPSLNLFQSVKDQHRIDGDVHIRIIESILEHALPYMCLPMENEDLIKSFSAYSWLIELTTSAGTGNVDKIYEVSFQIMKN